MEQHRRTREYGVEQSERSAASGKMDSTVSSSKTSEKRYYSKSPESQVASTKAFVQSSQTGVQDTETRRSTVPESAPDQRVNDEDEDMDTSSESSTESYSSSPLLGSLCPTNVSKDQRTIGHSEPGREEKRDS
eukprot:766481_1